MREKTYSKIIANAIKNYLTEDNWDYSFDERWGLFKFGVSIDGTIKDIDYIIDVKNSEYLIYAVSPIGADPTNEQMMTSMAEFICRANYGLKNGNFELDVGDGEIRFKCYVDCEGIIPTLKIIKNSIHCPAYMFNCYGTGIIGVIYGNLSVCEAISRCEKTPLEGLRAILADELNGDEDIETMYAMLAERYGDDEINFCTKNE